MQRIILILLFAGMALAASGQKSGKGQTVRLELKQIFATGTFHASQGHDIKTAPDGYYYRMYTDPSTRNQAILRYSYETADPVDTVFSAATTPGFPDTFQVHGYVISANGNYLLLQGPAKYLYRHSFAAPYLIYSVRAKRVKPLYEGRHIYVPQISPDEVRVGFVYENNLYYQNFKNDNVVSVSTDGQANHIINGRADWVYEEEFGKDKAWHWSPDGNRLLFHRFDESNVKTYTMSVYDNMYPTQYSYKYPLAGEANSVVSLHLYDLGTGRTSQINTGAETDIYLPRSGFTKNADEVWFVRMNRLQNNMELLKVRASDPNSPVLLYSETSKTYVDLTDNLVFLQDNSFLITSERDGYNQIFHYNGSGDLIRNIFPLTYDVVDILGYDPQSQWIYYTAHEPTPLDRTVNRIKLDGSTRESIIRDRASGMQSGELSSDFKYIIIRSSHVNVVPMVEVYRTSGDKVRTLYENAQLRQMAAKYNFQPLEYISIHTEGDEYLNAWVLRPPNFNKKKKYPVLFTVYGGPGHQTVTHAWGGVMNAWYQYLAQEGYIVVAVDGRGTGGRGANFKKSTYGKMGQLESDDIIAAARFMASQPYVDNDRIGIFGWSFGGYMALMGITKGSHLFDVAVAVAPVTDWRYYDNIYTERYMGLPADNEQNYKASSVMTYVPQMNGKLLLVHGTFDDNVHPHNSYALINELIRHNKRFDSEFYPDKNHSISGGNTTMHLFQRITDYILQNL